MNGVNSNLCALCGENPAIPNSHAIPAFSIKWLKDTSATGFLRQSIRPNLPRQDIEKYTLLCIGCEGHFSKFEKKFAEKIFIPFQEKGILDFQYDDWLLQFAVSLAWRTAVIHLENCRARLNPNLSKLADDAIECWKDFLLQKTSTAEPYTHHLLFLGVVSDAEGVEIPSETHRYLLRAVDATIAAGEEYIFVYTKLPGMIFWSGINPPVVPGWHKTQILEEGLIGFSQSVEQPGWGEFLMKRVNEVMGQLSQISDNQSARIGKKLESNPSRAVSSKTFEAVEADEYWDKRQRRDRPK